jgi:hypothetical protein
LGVLQYGGTRVCLLMYVGVKICVAHRLSVFENGVLRKVSGTEREE